LSSPDPRPGARSAKEERRQRAAALRAERERAERAAERRTRLLIALAVLAGVVAIGVAFQVSRSADEDAPVPAGVAAPAGGLVVGPASGDPVRVDEWLDFQCPFCKRFHESVGPQLAELAAAGTIRIEYHPLSFIGPESVRAANAFGCAIDAGEGPAYQDVLFANQPPERTGGYTEDELIAYGAEVGLTDDAFAECVRDDTFGGWVQNVAESGNEQGVTSTPTLIVEGERLEDLSLDSVDAAITAAASPEQ
jgi:protein-disulfide isomerase